MSTIKLSIYRLLTQLQLYSILHINGDISRRPGLSLIRLSGLRLRRLQFASFGRKNINIAKLMNFLNLSLACNCLSLARVNLASLIRALNSLLRLISMMMRRISDIVMSTRTILIYLLGLAIPL